MFDAPQLVDAPHNCEMHIDRIEVTDRHRIDFGDIGSLADSIGNIGLIHHVVVTPNNELIAGARRLAAMKSLGWEMIPVTVIQTLADATDRLLAERDENVCRKDFTASELIAIGRRLEDLERPAAKDRQREAGRRFGKGVHSSSSDDDKLKPNRVTNRAVGKALGISQTGYERLKVIDNATRDPNEEIATAAREQLALLDHGEATLGGATNFIRALRNRPVVDDDEEPVVVEPEPELPSKPKGGHRPSHLKILTNIVNTIDGFAMVLEDIEEINSTVNEEEARRLTSDLNRQIKSLNKIRNLLKGMYT